MRILLSRAPYTAHCSLRRAHTARAAVPGLRPSQRRPSAGSTALRCAPSAGQCRPSAGPSAGQCRPSAGHSRAQCRPSAGERVPVPSALLHCLHLGSPSPDYCSLCSWDYPHVYVGIYRSSPVVRFVGGSSTAYVVFFLLQFPISSLWGFW